MFRDLILSRREFQEIAKPSKGYPAPACRLLTDCVKLCSPPSDGDAGAATASPFSKELNFGMKVLLIIYNVRLLHMIVWSRWNPVPKESMQITYPMEFSFKLSYEGCTGCFLFISWPPISCFPDCPLTHYEAEDDPSVSASQVQELQMCPLCGIGDWAQGFMHGSKHSTESQCQHCVGFQWQIWHWRKGWVWQWQRSKIIARNLAPLS